MFIIILAALHIVFLHRMGSTSPTALPSITEAERFKNKFIFKDLLVVIFVILFAITLILKNPAVLLDPINFFKANAEKTPMVIKPEWYFLPFYTVLRSIVGSKWLGVLAMVSSILVLCFTPRTTENSKASVDYTNLLTSFLF